MIIDEAKNEAMGFIGKNSPMGSEVISKAIPEDAISKEQIYWHLVIDLAKNGWFRIIHSWSDGYLTAKSSSKLTIEG